jgi:hypothetical protein
VKHPFPPPSTMIHATDSFVTVLVLLMVPTFGYSQQMKITTPCITKRLPIAKLFIHL